MEWKFKRLAGMDWADDLPKPEPWFKPGVLAPGLFAALLVDEAANPPPTPDRTLHQVTFQLAYPEEPAFVTEWRALLGRVSFGTIPVAFEIVRAGGEGWGAAEYLPYIYQLRITLRVKERDFGHDIAIARSPWLRSDANLTEVDRLKQLRDEVGTILLHEMDEQFTLEPRGGGTSSRPFDPHRGDT